MSAPATIIEGLQAFIAACPHLDDLYKLNIDFIGGSKGGYSIEEVPTAQVITEYMDGSSERQYVFNFCAKFEWNEEKQNNINNCGFFEHFQDWLEECTAEDVLPELPAGMSAWKLEATSSGYLFGIEASQRYAKYQCQCTLYYDKKGKD